MGTDRITQRDLEAVCQRINRVVNGAEMEPWTRGEDGHLHQIPDCYVLSGAYGGWSLQRNCSVNGDGESHGVSDVFGCGHVPKRDLYERMQAFLRGASRWRREDLRPSPHHRHRLGCRLRLFRSVGDSMNTKERRRLEKLEVSYPGASHSELCAWRFGAHAACDCGVDQNEDGREHPDAPECTYPDCVCVAA